MKVEIDINSDSADLLFVENLKQTIADLEADLKQRKKGGGISIFSTDREHDIIEIERHLDAFRLALRYYGGPEYE